MWKILATVYKEEDEFLSSCLWRLMDSSHIGTVGVIQHEYRISSTHFYLFSKFWMRSYFNKTWGMTNNFVLVSVRHEGYFPKSDLHRQSKTISVGVQLHQQLNPDRVSHSTVDTTITKQNVTVNRITSLMLTLL